ncbi:unnamed protein product [Ectocarpus sp. 12 AP-2014]
MATQRTIRVVRWRDVGSEGVMSYMAPKMAENHPLLMCGYWAHQVLHKDAAQRWSTFTGIKSVLEARGLDQLRVDISCTKKGDSFRGDKASRQQVNLKLMDMVEIAEAQELGQPHWASSDEVGLDYYLCQCPVVSREKGKPEVLSAIAGEFRTPSCVAEEDLLQINLWMGAMETTTNLHYDANHNLLFVLKGSKRVALLPPDMTADVHAMPVFSESANHSGLQPAETAAVVDDDEAARKGAVYANVAEGEAIFIPEGWWHQVFSSRGTVAVNVWFKGARPALCEGPSEYMRNYYLRCLVESLLADRLREATAGDEDRRAIMAAADIEVATVTGDHALKPAADTSGAAAVEREWSPLCSPTSTVEERNLYLRTIGTDRMKEELPRVAHERPQDWARLVSGLDPLTAYVVTTQWEAAGGAVGMPEFYAAIFGTGEDMAATGGGEEDGRNRAEGATAAATAGATETGGTVQLAGSEGIGRTQQPATGAACDGEVVGAGGVGGFGVDGGSAGQADYGSGVASCGEAAGSVALLPGHVGAGEAAAAAAAAIATMNPAVWGGDGARCEASLQAQQQQLQESQRQQNLSQQDVGAGAAGFASQKVGGVALQERLVRLREEFVREQCGVVLNRAVGW